MVLLCDGDLELEISYSAVDPDPQCCFGIRIALRWGGEPLINPAIWKSVIDREGAPDAIWLYDWGGCPILYALEGTLQTNQPAIAEPLEPLFEFCIYPPGTSYYPYPGGWEVVYRTPEAERQYQDNIGRLTQEGPGTASVSRLRTTAV